MKNPLLNNIQSSGGKKLKFSQVALPVDLKSVIGENNLIFNCFINNETDLKSLKHKVCLTVEIFNSTFAPSGHDNLCHNCRNALPTNLDSILDPPHFSGSSFVGPTMPPAATFLAAPRPHTPSPASLAHTPLAPPPPPQWLPFAFHPTGLLQDLNTHSPFSTTASLLQDGFRGNGPNIHYHC